MTTNKTSIEAYRLAMESGLISKRQWQVVEFLSGHPEGVTQSEASRHFSDSCSSYQPRFRELEHSGVIKQMGNRLDPTTKRLGKVYGLNKVPTEKVKARKKNWVREKISEIGMQRFLQDMIDELKDGGPHEPYIFLLIQDLEMTLGDYLGRHEGGEK